MYDAAALGDTLTNVRKRNRLGTAGQRTLLRHDETVLLVVDPDLEVLGPGTSILAHEEHV